MAGQHRQAEEAQTRLVASATAAFINVFRGKGEKGLTADDLLGNPNEPKKDTSGVPSPKLSERNQMIYLQLITSEGTHN